MTVKELNYLKQEFYNAAMKNDEIAKVVSLCGVARVYELRDFDNRAIIVVGYTSQINNNTIREQGINPDKASVTHLFTVSSNHTIVF